MGVRGPVSAMETLKLWGASAWIKETLGQEPGKEWSTCGRKKLWAHVQASKTEIPQEIADRQNLSKPYI